MASARCAAAWTAASVRNVLMRSGNTAALAKVHVKGAETNRAAADAFARNVLPIIRQIQASGVRSYRAIAGALNARGIPTARGGHWHDSTVRNALKHAQ